MKSVLAHEPSRATSPPPDKRPTAPAADTRTAGCEPSAAVPAQAAASASAAAKDPQSRCAVCSKATPFKCAACNAVYYCSIECRNKDQPAHSKACAVAAEAAVAAVRPAEEEEQPPLDPEPAALPQAPSKILDSDWFVHLTGVQESEFRAGDAFVEAEDDPVPQMPGRTLRLQGPYGTYLAGKLSVVAIGELRRMADAMTQADAAWRAPCEVEFLTGNDWDALGAKLNVSAQQADPRNARAVFQAASNFNAVESPSDSLSPDEPGFTENYVWDRTQGPAASVSAGAAAIARVHAAFYDPATPSEQWRQTATRQIELLCDLREHYPVENGYVKLTGKEPPLPKGEELTGLLDKVRMAVHSEAQVTFGANDGNMQVLPPGASHTVDQVFCAAVNVGQEESGEHNASVPDSMERMRLILRAAYIGTYLAAIVNSRETVFLTLIGGGVFHNPLEAIYDAIEEAHALSGHPASRIKSVKVTLWNRPAPQLLVAKLKKAGVPVRITEYEGLDGCESSIA